MQKGLPTSFEIAAVTQVMSAYTSPYNESEGEFYCRYQDYISCIEPRCFFNLNKEESLTRGAGADDFGIIGLIVKLAFSTDVEHQAPVTFDSVIMHFYFDASGAVCRSRRLSRIAGNPP
jgi:hypothetical protein